MRDRHFVTPTHRLLTMVNRQHGPGPIVGRGAVSQFAKLTATVAVIVVLVTLPTQTLAQLAQRPAQPSTQTSSQHSLNPLTAQERTIAGNRARNALLALTGTVSERNPDERIQVLIAELRLSFGKSAAASANSQRLADVLLYDYRDDRTILAVVDLGNGQVNSMQAQDNQQPALNAWEADRARSIVLNDQSAIDSVKTEYLKATNQTIQTVDDIASLDSSVLVFTRIFAPDQVNAAANQCGTQRCAQMTFFAPDDIVLDLLVVINLSQGNVAQLMPFHSAGRTR